MDAKHLVGPMVGRGKADEVGIFMSGSSLDVMLAAIAKMISSSVRSVRSVNKISCRERASLVSDRHRRRFKSNPHGVCVCESPCPKENQRSTGRDDGIQIVLDALGGVGLTPPSWFMAVSDPFREIP